MKMYTLALTTLLLLTKIKAHSWTACTDYVASPFGPGHKYSDANCKGWIREWASYGSPFFGANVATEYMPINGRPLCHRSVKPTNNYGSSYTSKFPMAQYTVGESIRVLWPAKNHANSECSQGIPDTTMQLYYNTAINPNSDPTSLSGWTLVKDWHDGCTPGTAGCGFQNCIDFCSNSDQAICFGNFTVPNVPKSGIYTFMWWWAFGNKGNLYSSCWEANIKLKRTKVTTISPTLLPTIKGKTNAPTKKPVIKSTQGVKEYTISPTVPNLGLKIHKNSKQDGSVLFITITNVPNLCNINTVEITSNTKFDKGTLVTSDGYDPNTYSFIAPADTPYTTPITVRIIADEKYGNEKEILTSVNLIDSITADATKSFRAQFDCIPPKATTATTIKPASNKNGVNKYFVNYLFVFCFALIILIV